MESNGCRRFKITSRHVVFVACALIVTGYVFMSGPATTGDSFCPEIFSTRRIVVAPVLCLAGYLLMVIGILYKKS